MGGIEREDRGWYRTAEDNAEIEATNCRVWAALTEKGKTFDKAIALARVQCVFFIAFGLSNKLDLSRIIFPRSNFPFS